MRTRRVEVIALACCILFLLAVQVLFGVRKQGFHEDEFYSYFSTNRTAGLFHPDREWVETAPIRDEFVVLPGEGFRYGLVREVQSWDVHPPLYYQILHTVCSLFPGVFSKWTGIAVNLIAFVLSLLLLNEIARQCDLSLSVSVLLLALFGLNPATLSVNMFIRMYAWLTMWVLLTTLLHVRLWEVWSEDEGTASGVRRRGMLLYAAIALCDTAGFLTHYYYAIYAVLIAGVTVASIFLQGRRDAPEQVDVRNALRRVPGFLATHIAGAALALILYPTAAAHILRGYRGREATEAFFTADNLMERLSFFAGITWRIFLSDGGIFFAGIALTLFIVLRRRWRTQPAPGQGQRLLAPAQGDVKEGIVSLALRLTIACGGYFLIVSKTALLLGDTSIRYLAPVYPLLLLLMLLFVRMALPERGLIQAVAALMLVVTALGAVSDGKVLFLYRENAERIAYDDAHRDAAVIVAYNALTPERIWWITDHILRHEQVYFLEEQNEESLGDERIAQAQELLIYAADEDRQEAVLQEIADLMYSGGKRARVTSEVVWKRDMWTLYHMVGE